MLIVKSVATVQVMAISDHEPLNSSLVGWVLNVRPPYYNGEL
tara:strand:- start:258 stop:383 length:126 start_codon:yes stop_codon:yes gene_type:complete